MLRSTCKFWNVSCQATKLFCSAQSKTEIFVLHNCVTYIIFKSYEVSCCFKPEYNQLDVQSTLSFTLPNGNENYQYNTMYHTVLQQLSCMYIIIHTNLFVYKKQDIFLEKLRQLMLIFLFTQIDMYCRFLYNLFTWRYIRPLGKIFISCRYYWC